MHNELMLMFFVHNFLLHNDIKNEEVTGVPSSNPDSGTFPDPAIPLSPTSLPVMFYLFYHTQGKNAEKN